MKRDDNGHRRRFDAVCDAATPIVSDTIVSYVQATRGRVFDLPARYLDAAADSLVAAHPRAFHRRALLYLLVSGRFRRSTHPQLRDVTPDGAREFCREWERATRGATRRSRARARLRRASEPVIQCS